MDDVFDSLPEGSTLRACGRTGCAELARSWRAAAFAPRAPILHADDTGREVYFILSGRARAGTVSSGGRLVKLADLGPGASFGEIAAIDGGRRTTSVVALAPTRVARLTARDFVAVIESDRAVMHAVLGYLARRVRHLSARVIDVTTMSARERLIADLLARARPLAEGSDRAVVAGDLDHQPAARRRDLRPARVSRARVLGAAPGRSGRAPRPAPRDPEPRGPARRPPQRLNRPPAPRPP